MANVLLTTRCNLDCSYCFAREKMASRPRQRMSVDDACKVIDFLTRSDFWQFRVMGGEPTLHPDFAEIVTLALRAGMRVDVMSNATWQDDCTEFFHQITPARLHFLLNIDHPDQYRAKQWSRIEKNLAALPRRRNVTLSFNIFDKEPQYQYVLDLAERYDIDMVRLSFSLPVLGAQNASLPISDYQSLAPFVLRFVAEAQQRRIRVQIDNAIPLCMFDHEQIGRLILDGALDLNKNARCEPVIDIGPDLTMWCCFCLSKLENKKLDDFENLAHARAYYGAMLRVLQRDFITMDECATCTYRDTWHCQGGCITHALQPLRDSQLEAHLAAAPKRPLTGREVVALNDDVTVHRYDVPADCSVLVRESSGLEIELQSSAFESLIRLLDGRHTVDEIKDDCLGSSAQPAGPSSAADDFARQLEAESVDGILAGLMSQGFLVERSINQSGS